jgi:AraC-like DNA-binding protein
VGRGHDPSSGSHARASGIEGDLLSEVLRSVRLTGALFFLVDATTPWVEELPAASAFANVLLPEAQHVVSYHILIRGSCWGWLAGSPGAPIALEAGDILVIPHGDAYGLSTARGLRASYTSADALAFLRGMASGELPSVVSEGGGGPGRLQVLCGFLGCDVRPFNPVLAALPRLLHLPASAQPEAGRLGPLIQFALFETRDRRPGARCTLLRLSELLFVEAVRRHLAATPAEGPGWLSGLRDPSIGRALCALHERPAQAWTLARLAREVGLSRSTLAERFTHFVGKPPMQYLARWRMQLAARRLAEGAVKVSALARDVGYDSEAAFSRAFKRMTGVAPASWRRVSSALSPAGLPARRAAPPTRRSLRASSGGRR